MVVFEGYVFAFTSICFLELTLHLYNQIDYHEIIMQQLKGCKINQNFIHKVYLFQRFDNNNTVYFSSLSENYFFSNNYYPTILKERKVKTIKRSFFMWFCKNFVIIIFVCYYFFFFSYYYLLVVQFPFLILSPVIALIPGEGGDGTELNCFHLVLAQRTRTKKIFAYLCT